MSLYYLKTDLKRYRPLGHILAEYLGEKLNVLSESEICHLATEKDAVYYEVFMKPCNDCCLIGPEYYIANKWNSKIYQYNQLQDIVNTPSFEVFKNVLRLISDLDRIKKKWERFIIFEEFGYGGKNCLVCDQFTSVTKIFTSFPLKSSIRVSNFLPNVHNVSLHFVISGSNKIWLSPIVDQFISNNVVFKGGEYPSIISQSIRSKVLKVAGDVAIVLSRDGYRGLGHIDLMISNGNVFFTEINPRKASTTMCISYMMENCFNYTIPIIEYHAVRYNEILDIKQTSSIIPWTLLMLDYNKDAPHSPGVERDYFRIKKSETVVYNDFYDRCTFRINIKHENFK